MAFPVPAAEKAAKQMAFPRPAIEEAAQEMALPVPAAEEAAQEMAFPRLSFEKVAQPPPFREQIPGRIRWLDGGLSRRPCKSHLATRPAWHPPLPSSACCPRNPRHVLTSEVRRVAFYCATPKSPGNSSRRGGGGRAKADARGKGVPERGRRGEEDSARM